MSTGIHEPSQTEMDFSSRISERVRLEITQRNLDPEAIADILELLPSGVEVLLSRNTLPLDVSVRMAEAFGVRMRIEFDE